MPSLVNTKGNIDSGEERTSTYWVVMRAHRHWDRSQYIRSPLHCIECILIAYIAHRVYNRSEGSQYIQPPNIVGAILAPRDSWVVAFHLAFRYWKLKKLKSLIFFCIFIFDWYSHTSRLVLKLLLHRFLGILTFVPWRSIDNLVQIDNLTAGKCCQQYWCRKVSLTP